LIPTKSSYPVSYFGVGGEINSVRQTIFHSSSFGVIYTLSDSESVMPGRERRGVDLASRLLDSYARR
jgi:hypothetical protein